MVSIKGLDKADVLAALVNHGKPMGMGVFQDDGKSMTREQAQERIDSGLGHDSGVPTRRMYFDYVKGRPIKVSLAGDEFDPRFYDRDHGEGAAERAIASLR